MLERHTDTPELGTPIGFERSAGILIDRIKGVLNRTGKATTYEIYNEEAERILPLYFSEGPEGVERFLNVIGQIPDRKENLEYFKQMLAPHRIRQYVFKSHQSEQKKLFAFFITHPRTPLQQEASASLIGGWLEAAAPERIRNPNELDIAIRNSVSTLYALVSTIALYSNSVMADKALEKIINVLERTNPQRLDVFDLYFLSQSCLLCDKEEKKEVIKRAGAIMAALMTLNAKLRGKDERLRQALDARSKGEKPSHDIGSRKIKRKKRPKSRRKKSKKKKQPKKPRSRIERKTANLIEGVSFSPVDIKIANRILNSYEHNIREIILSISDGLKNDYQGLGFAVTRVKTALENLITKDFLTLAITNYPSFAEACLHVDVYECPFGSTFILVWSTPDRINIPEIIQHRRTVLNTTADMEIDYTPGPDEEVYRSNELTVNALETLITFMGPEWIDQTKFNIPEAVIAHEETRAQVLQKRNECFQSFRGINVEGVYISRKRSGGPAWDKLRLKKLVFYPGDKQGIGTVCRMEFDKGLFFKLNLGYDLKPIGLDELNQSAKDYLLRIIYTGLAGVKKRQSVVRVEREAKSEKPTERKEVQSCIPYFMVLPIGHKADERKLREDMRIQQAMAQFRIDLTTINDDFLEIQEHPESLQELQARDPVTARWISEFLRRIKERQSGEFVIYEGQDDESTTIYERKRKPPGRYMVQFIPQTIVSNKSREVNCRGEFDWMEE